MSFTTAPGVGRLERVPIKDVWPHEEHSFTPWLLENIDVLNDVIDITIENPEREQAAGTFSVDIVGEDENGKRVVVENQFGKSDHDHLGKLITYLTAFEAGTGIWIVEDPRPEHVAAIAWLNQSTASSFYLLKVEAVTIGQSPPAALLTRIVGPSLESRALGQKKNEIADKQVERQAMFRRFWTGLLEHAKGQKHPHVNVSPGPDHWLPASSGRAGLAFTYVVTQKDARIELYIDRGDEQVNEAIFNQLHAQKVSIESEFNGELDWQRLEGRRAKRIAAWMHVGGYHIDETNWPTMQTKMIDALLRFERALRPHIDQLTF